MGWHLLAAIIIGGGSGATVGAYLLYLYWDEYRWAAFLDRLSVLADNRLTRPLFRAVIGRHVDLWTIEAYVRAGRFARAGDLAVAEGLVDETLDLLERAGRVREAARLARRMARDGRADRLYRSFVEGCLEQGRAVLAAEVAEEAGFWDQAVELLLGLEGRESRLRAARLASEHGQPAKAVEIFLREEALLDAMRTAEEHGQTEFVYHFCARSPSTVLHFFGADAAAREGRHDLAVDILERHGHLHHAVRTARAGGLEDRAAALSETLRRRRGPASADAGAGGPFGFDFSDRVFADGEPDRPEEEEEEEKHEG